ncbi:NinF family protein [Jejubacter calystegiae]|uniref:NinF family protein n=1 Tax=Jejubacter calystegiae TaxID=2579935 RepID=A0A4P8YPS0_9ENTR|nr:NinF family protein [Jejubacter calystegiae]
MLTHEQAQQYERNSVRCVVCDDELRADETYCCGFCESEMCDPNFAMVEVEDGKSSQSSQG